MGNLMKRTALILLTIVTTLIISAGSFTMAKADDYQLELELFSNYAYVYDLTHDVILLDKNSQERMYPASLTKMMAEIIALENYPDWDQQITITWDMIRGLWEADASRVGYAVGDKASVRDLLYGVMLPSAADSVHALGITLDGSIEAFVNRMNSKAKELGMNNTHFVTPSGLHDDNHYSTCRDMALLLEYCIQNEDFVNIIKTQNYTTQPTWYYKYGYTMTNTVWSGFTRNGYPSIGLVGGKTGYTDDALYCLAVYAKINDMELIIITAHSDSDLDNPAHKDVSDILTALTHWQYRELIIKDTLQKTITVHHQYEDQEVIILSEKSVARVLPEEVNTRITVDFPNEVDSQLEEYEVTGTITVSSDDRILEQWEQKVTIPAEPNFFGRAIKYLKNLYHKLMEYINK